MRMRSALVPEQYQDGDWNRVRSPGVYDYAKWVREHTLKGRGLLLTGPVGTGKSTAAALVVAEALKLEMSARFEYVPDLVERLIDRGRRYEAVRACRKPDVLVWDDFGVGGLQDWVVGLMDQIVENRYAKRRPMIVTTNLTREQLSESDALRRMTDRWRERGFAVTLSGDSQRAEWRMRNDS